MSTIKCGQNQLYSYINKIIKESGSSFQSPALRQKHVRNVCHTAHYQYLTKFNFDSTQGFKRTKRKHNFHYVAMPMMTSQILKSVGFTKTQKCRYLMNETFFLKIKKFNIYTLRATLLQKSLVAEVTFKSCFS